jgi:hypothetical protein
MQTRRLDERLANGLQRRLLAKAEADRTKLQVDRQVALLLRNAGVTDIAPAEVRRIRDYAAATFGDARYYPWLYFYSLYRGAFREGWIPPDFFHGVAIDHLNGAYRRICGARTLYHRLLRSDRVPDLLYCVKGRWTTPDGLPVAPAEVRDRLFAEASRVVVKLEASRKGYGVAVETADSFDAEAWQSRGNLVVQRFVEQSPQLAAIYPDAVATIRINTIMPDAGAPCVAGSYLRLGQQGARTVNAISIDVPVLDADGRLCAWANTVDWQRLPRHPDTGFVFDGATVAGYAAAARACVALHERLPQFGFIGWDVAIDSEGAPQVLEMNIGQPDVKVIEMSVGPCLTALQLERYARRAA